VYDILELEVECLVLHTAVPQLLAGLALGCDSVGLLAMDEV